MERWARLMQYVCVLAFRHDVQPIFCLSRRYASNHEACVPRMGGILLQEIRFRFLSEVTLPLRALIALNKSGYRDGTASN